MFKISTCARIYDGRWRFFAKGDKINNYVKICNFFLLLFWYVDTSRHTKTERTKINMWIRMKIMSSPYVVVLRCWCSFQLYIEYPLIMLSLYNKTTSSNLSECINIHVQCYFHFVVVVAVFFFSAWNLISRSISSWICVCVCESRVLLR